MRWPSWPIVSEEDAKRTITSQGQFGLATDALERLGPRLDLRFKHAHPRTLRRYFLCIPAQLYLLGTDRPLVVLRVKRLRSVWEALLHHANSDPVRIPWLQNRKLLLALDKKITCPMSAGVNDPATRGADVWCLGTAARPHSPPRGQVVRFVRTPYLHLPLTLARNEGLNRLSRAYIGVKLLLRFR